MTTTTHEHPRRRRRFLALAGLAAITASLGAGAISLALFTDTQAVPNNAFATGTIDISTNPTDALFTVDAMMPGDEETSTIVVANDGTARLRYAIRTTVGSGASLAGQLQADVYAGAACSGTALYSGALSGLAVGSNATGDDTGDRELAGLDNETLCFKVTLPDSTDDTFQGATANVTFTFDAEQTANNP
jgi:predicted ribosomally synthesized peptide with SipW-like signal peptide